MPGILFPAYQKFYSAVSCLERFDKEQNFFDNISSLDNFFAEYRNITFVIQFALKHTDYFSIYEKNRDTYLTDHWFVEKRNMITKQKSFQLVKKIDVTVYLPDDSISLCAQSFTVENDIPMDSLTNDLKKLFLSISHSEIFFSPSFSFFEKGTTLDIWDKLISGIASMNRFMNAMYTEVGEDCTLCSQLREKINRSKFSSVPKDFWLINDYVYYPQQNEFKRADRLAIAFPLNGSKTISRLPLKALTEATHFNYDGTPFGTFVLMHVLIRTINSKADIMPTLLTIYNDDTFELDAFHADIKTTIYRKITEAAQKATEGTVRQICFMSLYSVIPVSPVFPALSKERQSVSSQDILVFTSIEQDLTETEYVFDGKALSNIEYVAHTMKYGRRDKLSIGRINMSPIIRAFQARNHKI